MRIGPSVGPFPDQIEEVPEHFDLVELSIGEMEIEPEEIDRDDVRRQLEEKDLDLIVHLPFRQSLATSVRRFNEANVEYLEKMLEFSAELGAEKAVLHVDIRYGEDQAEMEGSVKQVIKRIDRIGEEKGVEVVFENIPFEESKAFDLMEFGETMEDLGVSICFDTGHAYVEEGQEGIEEFLEEYLGQISHFHVQDSMGGDDHVAVGYGEIDWEEVGERISGFDGTVTLELFTDEMRYIELSEEIFLESLE